MCFGASLMAYGVCPNQINLENGPYTYLSITKANTKNSNNGCLNKYHMLKSKWMLLCVVVT
jgi:hypothetical protein